MLHRFVQTDTILPEPGNLQALNRYSYVLNNPLRYTDPTGMFSEDEIMKYLGVDTWDDVLAMFGDGGAMAGAWGYLEVLRQAELGTPISMWFDVENGFNARQPNMVGTFSEQDGTLVFSGAFLDWMGSGGSWAIGGLSVETASTLIGASGQYQVGPFGNYLSSQAQYLHIFHPERVDWFDFGVDLFGIVGDIAAPIAPVGTVIWATSELAELTSVGKSWDQLEIGNPADAMIDVGMPIAQSMKLAPQWGGLANTASLIVNLKQGFAYTP